MGTLVWLSTPYKCTKLAPLEVEERHGVHGFIHARRELLAESFQILYKNDSPRPAILHVSTP
jgi:hypothetical protein